MSRAKQELLKTVTLVEEHLRRLQGEGVVAVPADPETVRELGRGIKPAAPPAPRFSPQRTSSVEPAPLRDDTPILATPRLPPAEVEAALRGLAAEVGACQQCRLCKSRKNVVPGQGHPAPDLMFIGEGPGADEDEQGLAFVGKAGQLLTRIIEAMGLTRDQVFIGNIVKCRPPDNRVPMPDEMDSCIPYLKRQINLLKPKVIVALGATATKGLFGEGVGGITKIRGRWRQFQGIDVMPTYHPAYLLRNPPAKPDVWTDMKAVLTRLGLPVPDPKKS